MDNQKRENLLNLALDATEEERLKSVNLNVGYDPGEKTWELIVRYNGSLESLRDEGIRVDELAAGYAVLVVPESRIEQVSTMEQIVYIEKPKRLFFASNMARAASCLSTIQTSSGAGAGGAGTGGAGAGVISSLESGLTGKGVLVAVIDSGIDYFHPDFRNPDGTTRIGLLADQDRDRIYTREEINAALETGSRTSALALVPSTDPSGHGTAVAAIAAGNGREGNGVYRGVAYESELMVVKLGTPLTDSFPRTTQLMKALDLVVRRAQDMNRPLAVNISLEIPTAPMTGPVCWKPSSMTCQALGGMSSWPARATREPGPDTGQEAWSWDRRKMRSCPLRLMRQGWEYSCGSPMWTSFPSAWLRRQGRLSGPSTAGWVPRPCDTGERRS